MAILLTNGEYYIAHNKSGGVIKVPDILLAQDFHSVERAIHLKNKHPGKCSGYYFIDTSIVDVIESSGDPETKRKIKHKQFSKRKRLRIYEKTQGHCYLCGELVRYNSFEVEHKKPLSKGGTDDLDNLYCSCHKCNSIKHDICYEEFMEKITQIFMYQMKIQSRNNLRLKFIYRELSKMV